MAIDPSGPAEQTPESREVYPGLFLDKRGRYRWTYEMSLLTNPVIPLTMLKVFGGALAGLAALLFLLTLGEGIAVAGALFLQIIGYGALVLIVLLALGLMITSLILGGRYAVRFDMDEKGVTHTQLAGQFKRARAAARVTALLGALAGQPSVAGAGLLAGQKRASVSRFSHVKKIRARRSLHTIYLRGGMEFNQIYASPEQFDFILNYINAHCPDAKRG